jgi:TolB-like protein/Flp pilus assembly protein TadD
MVTSSGRWLYPLVAALVAALILFAWNGYPGLTGNSAEPAAGPEWQTRNQVYFGPGNSIAILPFNDGAAVPDQAFWSAGFSSELYHLLIRTQGLQVTSSNSSFYFQDQTVPLRVIAERLHSTHLLTGEFQLNGGQLRVEARLFDARKDQQLWSQVYQRDLEAVFALQDEILAAVVDAIRPGASGVLPKSGQVDTRAWTFYLQGLFLRQQRTPEALQNAEAAFRSALEIDPEYQLPRVGLAEIWLEREAAGDKEPLLLENARDAVATALLSRPEMPAAHELLSYIQRNYDWDWQGALDAAEQALSLSPGDPELMSTASLALFTLGRFERAGELLQASIRQDPLNLLRRLRLGMLQEFSGEYEQSLTSYRVALEFNPELPGVRAYRARIKIIQEKPDSAMKESDQELDPFWKRYSRILALSAQQRHDEAESLLEQMIADDGHHAAYQLTEILAFRGETDRAFEWFQRAYDQKDGGMSEIIGNHFLLNLHDDPRWEEMLIKMGLPLTGAATF